MKHLIYLIDGTWIFAGSALAVGQISNIYKLNMHLELQEGPYNPQIVHYVRGLGGVNGIRRYTSGGFSYGIDESIEDIYLNICSNYAPGDKIYLFGFSRGAAVARAVTGLLSYGILQPDRIHYMPDLWKVYKQKTFGKDDSTLDQGVRNSLDLVRNHSRSEKAVVDFLGIFDTVIGGMGRLKRVQKLNLHGMEVAPCVKNAVQLLAIDETRDFFEPLAWKGSFDPNTVVEQLWMPGVHSDIGGAYPSKYLGDAALLVMIDRILARTPLRIEVGDLNYLLSNSNTPIVVNDEYNEALWQLFSPLSRKRKFGGFSQYVHPFADDLSRTAIQQKKSKTRTRYSSLRNEDIPRSQYFISRDLKGKIIYV
ncbi:hypothetical protein BHAOGJBA_0406 [Methylobacterium hispanicum]|uniref:T6SS Phospholipase effector Tle1-like catalytic domain-containing protein n=1 Tax=Methylobacterium hispanicum TaxID=270350 RepID=A0AAV4ZFC0_9HYPH|nr:MULTISPECIES: DUF2235 domain-containing protein [Methylobacterium]GJD86908.1 hypothetical protein BHAOGJBA_0406 [Methylobacterium hispanicum]